MEGMSHHARTLSAEELPRRLADHPELPERVDAVHQIEIASEGGGTWAIDLTRDGGPERVRQGPDPAACRVRIAAGDFADLLAGRQRWTDAFVQGRISLDGDLLLALKLRELFAELSGA
jgi:putative sterol carrier protein